MPFVLLAADMQRTGSAPPNLIGKNLFRKSILITVALTILFAILQFWINYSTNLRLVEATFTQIDQTQLKAMGASLWNFSHPELAAQMEGITNFQFINYALLTDGETPLAEAGVRKESDFISREFTVEYKQNNQVYQIGTLYLQADRDQILAAVLNQLVQIIVIQTIIIFLVSITFLVMIEKEVTSHLTYAADYFKDFSLEDISRALVLPVRKSRDEIDILVDAFNELRVNLADSYHQRSSLEKKHSTLLENLPGMAYRCSADSSRTIQLASAGCKELLGYTTAQLTEVFGGNLMELVHPDDRELVSTTIDQAITGTRKIELNYRIITRTNDIRWVHDRSVVLEMEPEGALIIEGFIIDVTERKQQQREIEVIAAISQALRNATTREEMLPIILNQTLQLLNAEAGTLELIDPENGDSVVEYASGYYAPLQGKRIRAGQGLNHYIQQNNQPYQHNEVLTDTSILFPEVSKECRATAGVPLIAQGKLIGYLWIGRKMDIPAAAVRSLSGLADIAASAIQRATLFKETEMRLRRLIGLRNIDTAINSNQEIEFTLRTVVDQAITLLEVDAAEVLILEGNNSLRPGAWRGLVSTAYSDASIPLEGTISQQVILSREMIEINDYRNQRPGNECQMKMLSEGFLSGFMVPLIAREEVMGVLQLFKKEVFYPGPDWRDFLETLAGQAAIAVKEASLLTDLKHSNTELFNAYEKTIEGWSSALDLRDKETEGHSQRVMEVTLALCQHFQFSHEDLANIRRGALLHDIGKMAVPDEILFKPGTLIPDEWVIMRKHPVNAYQILSPIEYLLPALDIPYCHHEKWDGSGYPRGLKGKEIPLPARIFAVVDVWDALTSDRPYRNAISDGDALEYIRGEAGRHFDPEVVRIFNDNFDQVIHFH